MGVKPYRLGKKTFWIVDFRIQMPDGSFKRVIKRRIPTKEMALALEGKIKTAAFEGEHFGLKKNASFTVKDAWKLFEEYSQEMHRDSATTKGRANHVVRLLGDKQARELCQSDIVAYRQKRKKERSYRGKAPSNASLNREVALLRRMLNYAVQCRRLENNPISRIEMLRENNVRNTDMPERDFQALVEAAKQPLKAMLYVARDTGMRKRSILNLNRAQIDFSTDRAIIKLAQHEVKNNKAQTVVLTLRATAVLKDLLASHRSQWVFVNRRTGKPYVDIRKMYNNAIRKANLQDKGYWIHDQRRKFVTDARRAGVDESTIMSLSGHKTRSAFERYNVVSTADQEAAVEKIEASLQRGKEVELAAGIRTTRTREMEGENLNLLHQVEQLKKVLETLLGPSDGVSENSFPEILN